MIGISEKEINLAASRRLDGSSAVELSHPLKEPKATAMLPLGDGVHRNRWPQLMTPTSFSSIVGGLEMADSQSAHLKKRAMLFIVLIGTVSLFADMTYEGARSITGPFLAILGASSLAVGVVAGFGELAGYLIRLGSGTFADRTRSYWSITIVGYVVNLFAVPLLALAGSWPAAAALMIAERVGKGLRNPPRDVMLSAAGNQVGQGWGFGFHEAMDQTGATVGPLLVALVLFLHGGYRHSFALLLIPAVLAIATVVTGRIVYPRPTMFEGRRPAASGEKAAEQTGERPAASERRFPRLYWIYVVGVALIAAGFADFPLIAYHFQRSEALAPQMVPVLYAIAMAVDALAALLFGALFDRIGVATMIIAAVISLFFAPLVFTGGLLAAIVGMALWGVGMGAHESIMRAVVAKMIPLERRGRAYGLFNAIYGAAWFLGSALLGYLYGVSIPGLIVFSVLIQAASIPFLVRVARGLAKA